MKHTLAVLALLTTQIAHATPGTYESIAGKWKSVAEMHLISESNSKFNTSWTGRTSGDIDASGNINLIAENGCQMSGVATPSFDYFLVTLKATGCKQSNLNQKYSGYLLPSVNGAMFLNLSASLRLQESVSRLSISAKATKL